MIAGPPVLIPNCILKEILLQMPMSSSIDRQTEAVHKNPLCKSTGASYLQEFFNLSPSSTRRKDLLVPRVDSVTYGYAFTVLNYGPICQ